MGITLNKKKYNKTLREKLSEQIENAGGNDKEVMQETLEKLDINLEEKLVEPTEEVEEPVETAESTEVEEEPV